MTSFRSLKHCLELSHCPNFSGAPVVRRSGPRYLLVWLLPIRGPRGQQGVPIPNAALASGHHQLAFLLRGLGCPTRRSARRNRFAFAAPARQTEKVTSEQMAMISGDPAVMHGQAVIAGTRVPVSVILDCIAAGMTTEQITAEYPTVTAAGVRAAAAYGAALAREELLPIPQSR